jgi:hypothetical protein
MWRVTAAWEELFTSRLHLKVDVARAPWIQARFYGPEEILARGACYKAPVSLKIAIAIAYRALGVDIGPIVIGLPDLDRCSTDRLTALVENAATQPRDLADRRRDVIADDDEIVIAIERQPIRIVRSQSLGRSKDKLLRKCSRHREQGTAEAEAAKKFASIMK